MSLGAQGLDRIEYCRATSRQHPGGEANGNGDQFGKQHETERRVHRQRRDGKVDQLRKPETEQQAKKAAKRRQRHRFAEEERKNRPPWRAV